MRAHGSKARYAQGCRCLACSRNRYRSSERPPDLRWSIRYLTQKFNKELVQDHINVYLENPHDVAWYQENGLADFDADRLACKLGEHPMMIWPGWIEAGEDEARD